MAYFDRTMKLSMRIYIQSKITLFLIYLCNSSSSHACGSSISPSFKFKGSEAEALYDGFRLRRQTGNYLNDFSRINGSNAWLDQVKIGNRQVSISNSQIPPQQVRAYIVRSGRLNGDNLIRKIELEAHNIEIPIHRLPDGSISLTEHHIQILSEQIRDEIIDLLGTTIEINQEGGIHQDWETRTYPDQVQEKIHTIRSKIDEQIRKLDQAHGGYFYNLAHRSAHIDSHDIWIHRNPTDGNSMEQILLAIRDDNERVFLSNTINFASGYPEINSIARRAFIDSFSNLFITKQFPSIGSRQAFFHFILRCGHLY